jgi:SAM-dependent methyltransferase
VKTGPRELKIEHGKMQNANCVVLDACCGSKSFWFDKEDSRCVFVDIRKGVTPKFSSAGRKDRTLRIHPDVKADFEKLPFADELFHLVVFDPPHLKQAGPRSFLRAYYGVLSGNWNSMLKNGFSECFRVLKPHGTLVFKWSDFQIPVSDVITLSPYKPLFGQRCGKQAKTHWIVFTKPSGSPQARPASAGGNNLPARNQKRPKAAAKRRETVSRGPAHTTFQPGSLESPL